MTGGEFAVAVVAVCHSGGQLVVGVVDVSPLGVVKELGVLANICQGRSVWVGYERGSFSKTCLSLQNSLK